MARIKPRKMKRNWCPSCHRRQVFWDNDKWEYKCRICGAVIKDKKTLIELLEKEGLL